MGLSVLRRHQGPVQGGSDTAETSRSTSAGVPRLHGDDDCPERDPAESSGPTVPHVHAGKPGGGCRGIGEKVCGSGSGMGMDG